MKRNWVPFFVYFLFSNIFAQNTDYFFLAIMSSNQTFMAYTPPETIFIPPVDLENNIFTKQQLLYEEQKIYPTTTSTTNLIAGTTRHTYYLNHNYMGHLFYQHQKYNISKDTINSIDSISYPLDQDLIPLNIKPYLQPSPFAQSDNPLIVSLATELSSDNESVKDLVKNVLAWIGENIIPTNEFIQADAVTTLIEKKGNCANFSNLACAIFKALGVPSETVDGVLVNTSCGIGHKWIKLYLPSIGWIQMEPQSGRTNWDFSTEEYITSQNGSHGIGYNFCEWQYGDSPTTPSLKLNLVQAEMVKSFVNEEYDLALVLLDSLISNSLNPSFLPYLLFHKAVYYDVIDSLYEAKNLLEFCCNQNPYLANTLADISLSKINNKILNRITPKITTPTDNITIHSDSLLVKWDSTYLAEKYQLQLSSNLNFENILIDTTINNNSILLSDFDLSSKLYIRSKSFNKYEESNWSNIIKVNYSVTSIKNELEVKDYFLANNYPNPFNPSTTISYSIPQNEFITLKIYDVIGNEVATLVNTIQESGKHEVNFNASNLSSGIYFYKLSAGSFSQINKMMLVK